MKKVLIVLGCIIVVALCVIIGLMYKDIKKLETVVNDVSTQVKQINEEDKIQEEDIQNSDNEENVNTTVAEDTSKEEAPNKDVVVNKEVVFDGSKVKNAINGVKYEENSENYLTSADFHLTISKEGDRIYVSTNNFAEKFDWVNGLSGVKDVNHQEITGFNGKVVSYFLAAEGQDTTPPTILFLMEDGTVEYLKSVDMLKNNNFTSKGKISGLNNINKFTFVNVSEVNGGGHYSTVAIDNNGYSYDIFEMNID